MKDIDYRRNITLLLEAVEIGQKLVDFEYQINDEQYEIDALIDQDISVIKYRAKRINEITKEMKLKHSELVKQIDKIREELGNE